MGHLPGFVLALLKVQVHVVPVAQPILMAAQLTLASWCLLSMLRRLRGCLSYGELYRQLVRSSSNVELQTVLNLQPQHVPTNLANK